MNDTLEPPIIAAESYREWFLIMLMFVHTVLEWRMSIVKQQSENFNWFYKLCFKFFQDCYCVIKKMKNHELKSDSLFAKFPSEAWFWATTGNFHIRWENNTRNSLYNLTTRWLDNQHWIALLVNFWKSVSWHFQSKCSLLLRTEDPITIVLVIEWSCTGKVA